VLSIPGSGEAFGKNFRRDTELSFLFIAKACTENEGIDQSQDKKDENDGQSQLQKSALNDAES